MSLVLKLMRIEYWNNNYCDSYEASERYSFHSLTIFDINFESNFGSIDSSKDKCRTPRRCSVVSVTSALIIFHQYIFLIS